MDRKKDELEEYEESGSFRSLLLNYQFVKFLKITDSSRTVQAFDITTKRDVAVKFMKSGTAGCKSTRVRFPCEGVDQSGEHSRCSTYLLSPMNLKISLNSQIQRNKEGTADHCSEHRLSQDPWMAQSKILPVLSHRNIVKQAFYKKFGNYSAICIDYFTGSSLVGCLKEEDALRIFEQLASIAHYLAQVRVSIFEINLCDILVDHKREIRLIRLNQPRFEDSISPSMEKRCIHSLFKILHFLISGEELDMGYPYFVDVERTAGCIDEDAKRMINNKSLKNIYELLAKGCTVQALAQACGIQQGLNFKNRLLADPAVLLEVQQLGFPCSSKEHFNEEFVNNPSKKEYYLYRLIEENHIKAKIKEQVGLSGGFSEGISRLMPGKGPFNINRLENAECNAITFQEKEKHLLIKNRVSVLDDMMYYPSSLQNCMACTKLDTKSFLDLQLLKNDSFFDIMKVLRLMKVSSWRVKDKIKIREENAGLKIVIILKRNNHILVSKEHGRDVDFLHLVSELIEVSKTIG